MATPNNSGHDNAPPVNGPRRLQLSRLRQRLLALVIAGVGSAAASIISYASAIYAAANPEPIRQLAIGEELDTGLWHVVFADARLADRPPTGFKPSQPKTFVTVAFRITNQSASSAYVSRNLLQTDPQMPPPHSIWRATTGSQARSIPACQKTSSPCGNSKTVSPRPSNCESMLEARSIKTR